ncbi:MAG: hypothetical protein ACOVLE_15350, partial [Pirellula staleyi]
GFLLMMPSYPKMKSEQAVEPDQLLEKPALPDDTHNTRHNFGIRSSRNRRTSERPAKILDIVRKWVARWIAPTSLQKPVCAHGRIPRPQTLRDWLE